MFARVVPLLALLLLFAPRTAAADEYTLRDPQIPVSGSGLQDFLQWMGESIDVQQAQLDVQLMQTYYGVHFTLTFQMELGPIEPGLSVGLYDGSTLAESFVEVFPVAAGPGWFAVVSFRTAPTRIGVNLFDSNGAFMGTRTTLGGNRRAIGFAVRGPDGAFYSQDARNPGGAAQALFYLGTGITAGSLWTAFEAGTRAGGAEGDFDDAVVFLESNPFITPLQRTSWGQLKERFR